MVSHAGASRRRATREGRRARLRLRSHRRRGLRPDRHDRAPARGGRARRERGRARTARADRARGGCRARRRRPAADAARRARRAGARDRRLRPGAARAARRPGRELRRALHDGPRGEPGLRRGTRGRARRRPPAVQLPRVVERRDGVMPPQPRRPRRTPRSVVWRRRAVALAVLVAAFLAAWFAVASVGGSDESTPTATTAAVVRPKPFRVVFPEGFTRKQMAARITAVAQIARRERGKRVRLKEQAYLAATAGERRQPGFGPKALPLEGFLFPATYDFTARTTSAQLVAAQLKAFRTNWAKLNLAYARSKNLTPYDVLIIASMIEKETPAPEERQLVSAVIYNRLHAR